MLVCATDEPHQKELEKLNVDVVVPQPLAKATLAALPLTTSVLGRLGVPNNTISSILECNMKETQDHLDPEHDELRHAFRLVDADGSGELNKDELRKALAMVGKRYTDKEFDELFSDHDRSGDGSIDFEEFKAIVV